MSKHLARDLVNVERQLLRMSALVEDMIRKACRALKEKNGELAREVITSDDEVDEREVQIEEECLKILALHQPVAGDLRSTATMLKVNNDLERIADLAANIAERALRLERFFDFEISRTLDAMSERALKMVGQALDALVELDPDRASKVLLEDNEIDDENVQVINELYHTMRKHPEQIEPALHCFSAARHIERIADHATNIAEDVIYLVRGDIARHRHNTDLSTPEIL